MLEMLNLMSLSKTLKESLLAPSSTTMAMEPMMLQSRMEEIKSKDLHSQSMLAPQGTQTSARSLGMDVSPQFSSAMTTLSMLMPHRLVKAQSPAASEVLLALIWTLIL